MVNSRVTIPTQFCPTLKPKFSTWRKPAFFTMSPTELPRYPVSHMAQQREWNIPVCFWTLTLGLAQRQDLDAGDWLGRGYISLEIPLTGMGRLREAASWAVDCGTTNKQRSMPRSVAGWPASSQGTLETMVRHLGKVLKGQTGVLKEKSNIQRQGGTVSRRSGESRKASAVWSRGPTTATTQR